MLERKTTLQIKAININKKIRKCLKLNLKIHENGKANR